MPRPARRPSNWTITTPEAIVWSACEFYEDPEAALRRRIERARKEFDKDSLGIFEAALQVLKTKGRPTTLRFAASKNMPSRNHG